MPELKHTCSFVDRNKTLSRGLRDAEEKGIKKGFKPPSMTEGGLIATLPVKLQTTNSVVGETVATRINGVVNVAAVKDNGLLE